MKPQINTEYETTDKHEIYTDGRVVTAHDFSDRFLMHP
jgi:hypothetical protein